MITPRHDAPPGPAPSDGPGANGPYRGPEEMPFPESRSETLMTATARRSIAVICVAALLLALTPAAAIVGPLPNSLAEITLMAELVLATTLLLAGWRLVSEHRRTQSAVSENRQLKGRLPVSKPETLRAIGHVDEDAAGFDGVTQMSHKPTQQGEHALGASQARINDVLATRALVTAFQPIYSLTTRTVIGAEALTRIVSSPVRSPETWFAEAESVGRGVDLEFLAMETALRAAERLPEHIYVAVNLSPQACMDPRLSSVLLECGLPAGRIVVELTERAAVAEYVPLLRALRKWRQSGLRIAVDDAGAGYASMRHILHLKPDLIKLDRSIIASINADRYKRALCAAMVSFAQETSAKLVAEGLETETELAAIKELGVDSAQGYFLGKPSTSATEWVNWSSTSSPGTAPGRQ